MADNTVLNSGSGGDTISTDDIAGVKVQRVKVQYGVDGSATDVSDSNPLPIDDAGGSLTVDGTVTANLGTADVTNAGTFAVQVDGAALTALQLIDDAVHADDAAFTLGTSKGVMMMGFAGTQSVDANDAGAIAIDTDGAVHIADGGNTISIDDGAGSITVDGTVSVSNLAGTHTDDAAFTPATDDGVPAFAMFDDVTPDSVDEGDAGILRMSANRNLYSTIRDAAGNERGANVDGSNNLQVVEASAAGILADTAAIDTATGAINTNTTDIPNVIGTDGAAGPSKAISIGGTDGSGNLQEVLTDTDGHLQVDVLSGGGGGTQYTLGTDTYAETTSIGTIAGAVRYDAGGTLVNTDNEIAPLQVDSSGALRVTGGGGGTEYTEDTAAAANPVGGAMIGVRDDLLATNTVSADGDNIALRAANTGGLYTAPANFVSSNNSTTTPLGISGNFTGTGDDCAGYSTVTITLYADQDSAVDGMKFQFSTDNSNWDDTYSFTLDFSASATRRFQFPVTARYFRVNFTNGGTGQGAFRVQTILHAHNQLTSVHRLVDNVSPDRSAQVVKSAIFAQTSGSGDFVAIAANASGKLQVAAEAAGTETPADGDATPTDAIPTQAFNSVYNGTTWDLVREGGVAGSILVDGSGVTQPVSGTITETNSAAILADTANMDTNIGTIAGAVAGTEMQVDVLTIAAGDNNIGNVDIVTLPASTNTIEVVGDVAHGVAVAGNPLLVGLEGRTTDGTAVDDGDSVRALATSLGKQVTYQYAIPAKTWSYASTAAVTDTADDVAQAAGGAGVRNYVTGIQVFNGSDSVGTEVVIKDGSTVIWRGWAEETGGGCSARFDPPLRGTANTAINVANITTASSTYFNLQGFQSVE